MIFQNNMISHDQKLIHETVTSTLCSDAAIVARLTLYSGKAAHVKPPAVSRRDNTTMNSVLRLCLFACLGIACDANPSRPPQLPDNYRDRLANLNDIFMPIFQARYPERANRNVNQYAVMTFDDAGFTDNNAFDPCPSSSSFTADNPTDYVVRTWQDTGRYRRHAEVIIVTDYFQPMLQRYRNEHGANRPQVVNLFTYNSPCRDRCAAVLANLARDNPAITFYIGYEAVYLRDIDNFEDVLETLSHATNLFFGNVRGDSDLGPEHDELRRALSEPKRYLGSGLGSSDGCWFGEGHGGEEDLLLYGSKDNIKKGYPPQNRNDAWEARATVVGRADWSTFKFLFFDPQGVLHGVYRGRFYKASPPTHGYDNWVARATLIGSGGWDIFRFLFFHPDGDLYGVTSSGEFYKGPPPVRANDNWLARATKIGTNGWTAFKVLFFDPVSKDIYGVIGDRFFRAPPPTYPHDNWTARAACIGSGGWSYFKHLFFDPNGLLYGASDDGKLRVGPPPEFPSDCWTCRTELRGSGGWQHFQFLFFDPNAGT